MEKGFDLIASGKKALVSIFEKKFGRKASYKEIIELHELMDEMVSSADREDKAVEAEENDEVKDILRQDKIEQGAQSIRMVVAIYIELQQEPYPYKLKKDIPLLKEAHAEVLKNYQSGLYPDIVKYAYEDMFVGDLRILGDTKEDKRFFEEYTNNPSMFNIQKIKDFIPDKYLPEIPMDLCIQ